MGSADCDGLTSNGCETNLNTTLNCGGCGAKCIAAGGTNPCVLVGAGYVCKPVCDATHFNCDNVASNGCEADLTSAQSCGACGVSCMNPHGSSVCSTTGGGYFCSPTCSQGFGACAKPEDGCTTDVGSDPDRCGDCTRACSTSHVASRACTGGACKPSCTAPWADCSQPAAPGADDGCETNGTADSGESDNACGGQSFSVGEASSGARNTNRILPSGDLDVFTVKLVEGSHICVPGTGQSYNAKVTLTAPAGASLALGYNLNSCDNTFSNIGNVICINWGGTCAATDDRTFYFQIKGNSGASSCSNYGFTVEYCSEGTKCSGC